MIVYLHFGKTIELSIASRLIPLLHLRMIRSARFNKQNYFNSFSPLFSGYN